MIALLALLPCCLQASQADYYAVDYLTPPAGEVLEVGGLGFRSDGTLVVSTRRGQVWLIENALEADPADARFRLFAEGLWEGLGLTVIDDSIYVIQRGELSRLVDLDGDERCDRIDTLADDWGLSGNYHEFTYGLPVDDAGNFYISLNVSFFSPEWWHGKSTVPWRGWVMKIDPSGNVTPFASGLRSPCGLGFNTAGDLFATDNQGDWMPASPIFHVEEGGFYGHPASLAWTKSYREAAAQASDRIPPAEASTIRRDAACWLPYDWSRSPGNLVPDSTNGGFGPFGEQLFLAELTNGAIFRVQLEKVRGAYQGAVFPFRAGVGSACRVAFAPDHTLIVGMTNRGWGGRAPAAGLARVRWTGREPFEIERVHLEADGFRLHLTDALHGEVALGPEAVAVRQYDYDYWWEYGSPERDSVESRPKAVQVADDRRSLFLELPDLVPAKVARLKLEGLVAADGRPLLNPEFAYTVNQLVDGPRTKEHIAKIVPPPAARESEEEGWLRLTWGDATDGWNQSGWELCDVELDPDDPTRFRTKKGVGALANTGNDEPSDYASKFQFGSGTIKGAFMLPKGGRAALLIQGRYRIILADRREDPPTPEMTGGVDGAGAWPGVAPSKDAYNGAGEWNEFMLHFEAARFDSNGDKLTNARIAWANLNEQGILSEVELPEASNGLPEVPLGPLVIEIQGTHAAFGNVQFSPVAPEIGREGWTLMIDPEADDPLADWSVTGEGYWEVVDGVLTSEGRAGALVSPRGDYTDFELRARAKISAGGQSGLYLRATPADPLPTGYKAQINSSFADLEKTGSLHRLSPVKTHLIPEDTWFDYHAIVTTEAAGTRVQLRINGVLVTNYLDTESLNTRGHVAIQQNHQGSVLELTDLYLREL